MCELSGPSGWHLFPISWSDQNYYLYYPLDGILVHHGATPSIIKLDWIHGETFVSKLSYMSPWPPALGLNPENSIQMQARYLWHYPSSINQM